MSAGVCARLCVSAHMHMCVCVCEGPAQEKESQDSGSPPPMASVSSLSAVCMTLPTPPTSRMASRRGQPLAQDEEASEAQPHYGTQP